MIPLTAPPAGLPEHDAALPPPNAPSAFSASIGPLVESLRQQGLTCLLSGDGKTVLTLDGSVHLVTGMHGKSPFIDVSADAIPEGFEPVEDGCD